VVSFCVLRTCPEHSGTHTDSRHNAHASVGQVSQVFVRESSMVPIYSVLLFGGELTVLHERGLLKVGC
jgi:hypothetical protein